MQKCYVTAEYTEDADGIIIPIAILWSDGRRWKIRKVLHTCIASHYEFEGIRYTIKIGRAENTYIEMVNGGMLTTLHRRWNMIYGIVFL